jgi:hypothetical protein
MPKTVEIPQSIITLLKKQPYMPKKGGAAGTMPADLEVIKAILGDKVIMDAVMKHHAANGNISVAMR